MRAFLGRFRFSATVSVLGALAGGGLVACGDDGTASGRPAEPGAGGGSGSAASPRFGTVNEAFQEEMRNTTAEEDGPFYMVNLIKYREFADYADGRETDLTGREADALYAPLEFLQGIGAQPVFVADVERQLLGSDVEWDQVAVVRYPTRAKFFEMIDNPEFQARAAHKGSDQK